LTTLNTAVVLPMPSAISTTANAASAGAREMARHAWRMSYPNSPMEKLLGAGKRSRAADRSTSPAMPRQKATRPLKPRSADAAASANSAIISGANRSRNSRG
jgi:hypothetical protein